MQKGKNVLNITGATRLEMIYQHERDDATPDDAGWVIVEITVYNADGPMLVVHPNADEPTVAGS